MSLTPSAVAVIVTTPALIKVTTPFETVANVSSELVHETALFVASTGSTVAVKLI